MLLTSINGSISSNAASGGFLKNSNSAIIVSIPERLFDQPGYLLIKGAGFCQGGSNPSNTTPDELSFIIQKPNISDVSDVIFSKVFTANLTTFEFEIKCSMNTSSGSFFMNVLHQDGTIKEGILNNSISPNTFYNFSLKHTSVSSLYSLSIFNLMAEYKSFQR